MKNKKITRLLVSLCTVLSLVLGISPVHAATTSNVLVNTESFFIIDEGDGTTNIQLQFGDTVAEIFQWDRTNGWFNFSDDIHVEGDALVDGDLTLDHHDAGGDVYINFGGTLGEYIQWDSLNNRFNISEDINVAGGIEVAGDIDFNQNKAVEMLVDQGIAFPVAPAPVEGQLFYRTDLDVLYYYDGTQWVAPNVAGSDTLFLVPVWSNTTYYADGTNNTGNLTNNYDNTNNQNYYRWRSTRPALQDYDVVSKLQLPYNFSSWDGTADVTFVVRTTTTNTADNAVDLYLYDTAGAQNLAGNTGLVSSVANTWRTYTFTTAGGTWTPGSFIRLVAKGYSRSGNNTDMGYVILKFNTN
ncbi:hypothetical protein JW911_00275 [Candidatus Peregrinibacteria bacterium]|nr:hypothetical protein [Candidatus Peregrinibacteria bacterium]